MFVKKQLSTFRRDFEAHPVATVVQPYTERRLQQQRAELFRVTLYNRQTNVHSQLFVATMKMSRKHAECTANNVRAIKTEKKVKLNRPLIKQSNPNHKTSPTVLPLGKLFWACAVFEELSNPLLSHAILCRLCLAIMSMRSSTKPDVGLIDIGRIVLSSEKYRATAMSNMYRKFGEVWICGFWDTRANAQSL